MGERVISEDSGGRTPWMAYRLNILRNRKYRAKYQTTRFVLLWEAFWRASALLVAVVVGSVAMALLEIPQSIGEWAGPWWLV